MKEKIMNYFRQYWRSRLFMKSVSVLVAVCFVINVANLPVYAQSGRVEDELLNKRIENHAEKQEAVTNPAVMKPVNEQIGSVVNIEGLDSVSRKELDRKDMAVTEIGAILERSRDGAKERIVGSYDDEKKKISIHTHDSSRNYSKEVKADYEFRALQVLDSGAKRGSFVETHSKEFLNSEANRGVSGKGEEREEKQGFEKRPGKYEDEKEEGIEIGIKDAEPDETVYRESDEVVEKRVNEESAESKHNALKALIKEKDTASVTKATIEKIQETAAKSGLELVAKKNAGSNETQIELYSSKFTGENIFVAKSGGQMAYPTHNGSVEIRQSKDKINIGGNEFEKTGISLVSGERARQDDSINRKAEGLFITEMLSVFSGERALDLEKGLSVSVSERASSALVKTLDGINKGVLAGQSLFAEAAVKAVKGSVVKPAGLSDVQVKGEEKNKDKDYEDVADELAKQSGLSREEVDKALGGIEKSKLDNAIGLLKDFFAHGGQIINCATDAISNILGDTIGKGVIALQALSNDIASGVFGKESIKDGQIHTSMSAMNKVLKDNGKDSAGYGISLEDFKEGLKEGESGILWVDGNHYVTVTKEKDGKFSVADVNRNAGEKITYSGEEFDKLMSGKEAMDVDGVTRGGYQVDANDMKVLTDSEGIKEKASEGKAKVLSEEDMEEIKGAKYVTRSVTRTRTETRVGIREEERTGTRSYTDEKGESHSEQYTYTVEVEYTYDVEVEYTEEETVWVDDPEDEENEEEKEAIRKAEEEKERAREEAQRAQEAEERARLEAEAAQRNLEREIEARESAAIGENTKKDESGKEITEEISAEEAQEESAAFEEKIAGMEEEVVNKTIEAQVSAQEYEEKSGVAEEAYKNNLEKIEGTENRDEKALETAQKEYNAAQGESEQAQKNLEQATKKFVNLSGNTEEFKGVEQEEVNKALKYLNNVISNGGSVVNCAAEALSNVIGGASKAVLALQAISIDIGSGAFFKNNDINNKDASQVMVSMDAMKKLLKDGEEYKGYLVGGVEAVKEGLANGSVILNVNVQGGKGKETGHYISLHTQENGDVTIKDVNKEDKVITKSEIESAKLHGKDAVGEYLKEAYNWQGGAMLATGEIKSGKAMSESAMQETAGAGIFSWAKRAVNTVRRAFSGGGRRSSYSSSRRSSGGYRSGGGYSGGRSSYNAPRYSPRAAYTPKRSYTPSYRNNNVSKPRGLLGGLLNTVSSMFGRSGRNTHAPSHNAVKPRGLFGGVFGIAAGIFGNWKNNGANRDNALSPAFKLFAKGLFNSPTGKVMTGKTALDGVLGALKAITKSPQVQNAIAQAQLNSAQKRATEAAASGTAEEQSAANEALEQAENKARTASENLALQYEKKGEQEKADALRANIETSIKGGRLAVTGAGAGLDVSYDKDKGFTVNGENLSSPVAVSDIGDGSVESFKKFADTYKEGSEAISGSGLKLQYNKEKDGFGITGERIEGEIDLKGTNAQELAKAYKASEGTDLKFSRNEQTGAVEVSGSALESPINISGKNMEEMVETYKELGDSGLKLGYDEGKGYTISVPGSEKKVSVKDIKDGDIKSFVEDYKRVSASQNFGESGLELSFDEHQGIFVISGTHLESPVAVSDIDGDIDEFARQYGRFASVMGEDSGLTLSYDPEKGLLVKGDNLSAPVNAEDVEDASVFVEQYNSASAAIGDSGLSLSYDKEKGLMIGGGELSSPVAVSEIADGDVKGFVSDYKAASSAKGLEGSGLKLEFDASVGRLVLSGDDLENSVAVRDIKDIDGFVKQYKSVSDDISEDSGLKLAYDAEKGLMVTGEVLSESVAVSEVDDIKSFVKQYKETAGELGESGLKLDYEKGKGLLLSGENLESPIAVSDVKNIKQLVSDYEAIEGSGLKLGYDGEKKEIVVSGENLESPISASDIGDMKKFASDYKAIEGSGLKLGYDGEKKEIVVSGENFETPIAVSDIDDMSKFAKDYKTVSDVMGGAEGAGASYNKETQEWELTLPNINKKINASDIDNAETFVQQYKTVMDAYEGIEGSSCAYDAKSKEWTIKVPGVEDAIKASAISDGKTFADEYNAAKAVTGGVEGIEGVEDKDVTFGYNSETQKWEVKVPGYDKAINVSDIGTSEEDVKTFIDDYKILKDIKDNYESGAKFEYDAENGWTVSLPDIAESKDPSQALEQLKDIKEKQDALADSKEVLDEKQENFTNGEEAWNQAVEDYINGNITEEQYQAAKEKRDKERSELQTAIDDVDAKSNALEESQTNAGYSQEHKTASVSGYREASKNAKSVMETADESANNTAAEALKNAADSYAGVFKEPGEGEENKTPEEMQAAQDKYLRALTAVNDTTAAVNATYTNNNSEEEAKKKQEAQSKKTGDTVNEAQTKVTDAIEEAMIGAHNTLSGSDVGGAAAQQARNILDFISKAGKPLYDALTDLSVNLYGDISKTISDLANRTSLASQGITISNGIVTQRTFDKAGSPVMRELQLQNSQSDADIMSVMAKDGFDAGMNYIKAHGLYKEETLYNYDADGNKKEIYKAKSIGISGDEKNGNASVGIEYTFSQAYSDELYLVDIHAGQSKIITESFSKGEPEFAMVYDATPSSDSDAQTKEYKTDSGLTIKTTSKLGSVERVTQWGETEREDGVTRRIAKTVTFKDGLPSTFESTTVTFDASNGSKNVTPDTILLDGAVTYPGKYDKPTGEGGSDEEQRTIVDEYADLLKAAEGLKINGQDYDVFNAVSNDHIDLRKAVTGVRRSITFEGGVQSSANSSTLEATESGEGGRVGASLPLYAGEGQSVPNDWRNHYKDALQESINSGTQGTVSAYDDKGRVVAQAAATFTDGNNLIGSYTIGRGEDDVKFYRYETSADGKTETVYETTTIDNQDAFDAKNILTLNGDFSNCNKIATTTNANGSKTVVASTIEGGETQSERTLHYGRYGNITGGSGWDRQSYKKNENGSGIVGTSTIEYTYDLASGEFKVSGETFDPGAKFYMNAEDTTGLNISSSGEVTFDGNKYNITTVDGRESLFNAAMKIKADEAAYEAMSSMCTDGQKVVKDSDGNYMIVEDKIFAEGEEGWFTNSKDNVEVFDRNGNSLGMVDDGSIRRTSVIENDKVRITYDDRNWAGQGDVNVAEITLLSDGSRVTVSMNHNTQFFGDDTTNTTVTKTNADGSEEVIVNKSGNLGFFGGGKGNDLKRYGDGTYTNGTIDLGNGTAITVSDVNFTSTDNIFGLSGKYQRSSVSVAGVNGDDRQVLTTDSIRNANGHIVANAAYNTTLDKSSLPEDDPNTAYDERLKSFDPMNRQNATVGVQVTNYDLKTGEIASSSYEGRAYADGNNVIQAGYDWQSSNTDAPAFTFRTPDYIQSVKNELSELGYGDVQIMPGFELPGEFNGKPMNEYFVFYEDNGWWGIDDRVTLVDRTTGEKFTASSSWGDGDPVIRANPNGSGDAVTIKKTDTGVQLNFSQQIMVREAYTTTTARGGSIYHSAQYRTDEEGEIISVSNNEDGSWSQYSYRDITNKRMEMKTTEFSSNGIRTVERTLEGDWSGNRDELGRPPELANISGKEIIYNSTGEKPLYTTEISGSMKNIKYDKSSISEFTPANYTETTTNNATDEKTRVEYNGGILKYKAVDGQRIVVGAENVDRTTSVWVGGKDNGYFQVITKEHINKLSKTVSSIDDTDSSGEYTGTKTVTETTTASDIDTTYYVDGKPVYTANTKLLTGTDMPLQTIKTVYDKKNDNRVISETQTGGIFETKLMRIEPGMTDKMPKDIQAVIDENGGIPEGGLVIDKKKNDKTTTYEYGENGLVTAVNTDEKQYDYMAGTVTDIRSSSRTENGKTDTASETYVYGLTQADSDAKRAADKNNVISHTANYSSEIIVPSDIKEQGSEAVKEYLEKRGMDLTGLTDEQRENLSSMDKFILSDTSVNFISGEISVIQNAIVKNTYNPDGTLAKSEAAGTKTTAKADAEQLSQSFESSDFSSLYSSAKDLNSAILSEINYPSKATLLSNISTSKYNTVTEYKYDVLKRLSSTDESSTAFVKNAAGELITVETTAHTDIIYDSSAKNGVLKTTQGQNAHSDTIVKNAAGEVIYTEVTDVNVDAKTQNAESVSVKTDANGNLISTTTSTTVVADGQATTTTVTRDAGGAITEQSTSTAKAGSNYYSYGNLSNSNITINIGAVTTFNESGFARDAQIEARDHVKNTIIAAAVTVAFVVLSIATLGIGTAIAAGASAAIIAAKLAMLAFSAVMVYQGTKAAMDALSVGDYGTAALNAAFVALNFIPVIGKLASKSIQAANAAQAALKAGQVLTKTQKIAMYVSRIANNPVVKALNNVLNPFSAPTISGIANPLLQKVVGLGIGIARNAVLFQGVPYLLNKAGILSDDIYNDSNFRLAMTFMTFAPIFSSKFPGEGAKAGSSSSGKLSLKELFSRPSEGVRELYKKAIQQFRKSMLTSYEVFTSGTKLAAFGNGLISYGLNTIVHTAGMVADIVKFQKNFTMIAGTANTLLYEATGTTLGEIPVLGLMFEYVPVFDSFDGMTTQIANQSFQMINWNMILFSAATPIFRMGFMPLFQKLPVVGNMLTALDKLSDWGRTKNQQLGTFLEENVKENYLGQILELIPGLSPQMKEMLQECFDTTPDGMSMNAQMINNAYNQSNSNAAQTLSSAQTSRSQRISAANSLVNQAGLTGNYAAQALTQLTDAINSGRTVSRRSAENIIIAASKAQVAEIGQGTVATRESIRASDLSPMQIINSPVSIQSDRQAAAETVAENMGLTGVYAQYAISNLAHTANIGVAPAIFAFALANQSYGQLLTGDQAENILNVAKNSFDGNNIGGFSEILAQGVIPLEVLTSKINIAHDGKGNIDFQSVSGEDLNSLFNGMTNRELSDFIDASRAAGSLYGNNYQGLHNALSLAVSEFSKSAQYVDSVKSQIANIIDANQGKPVQEIKKALEDYKSEEGLNIREAGVRATFVDKAITELNKQNAPEIGDQEFKNSILELQNELDKAKTDTERDALIDKYTGQMSEVLRKQMFDSIINRLGGQDSAKAKRFASLASQIENAVSEYKDKNSDSLLSFGEILEILKVSDAKINEAVKEIGSYEKQYGIPFAPIAAIAGFRSGQMAAFRHIVKATVVDRQQPDIRGYAEQLQTAGGKSLIGAFTLELLMSLPDADLRGKVVAWLTNEDTNSGDLRDHVSFIFGTALGKMLYLNQAEIDKLQKEDGGLRKAFEEASIAIMTYSSWSSLFSSSMASLLAYSNDASDEIKAIAEHNRAVLKNAGIELVYTTKNGETKVQFKDSTQARAAIDALIENGKGMENTDIPLEKISMMVGDEFDYAYGIPASALASASGSYSAVSPFADYYNYLLDAANKEEPLTAAQKEALANKYGILGIDAKQIEADIQMSAAQLTAKAAIYSEISKDISEMTQNGKLILTDAQIRNLISEYTNDLRAVNTPNGSIESAIRGQIESLRMLSAYRQLLSGIQIKGKTYTIAELAQARGEDKGGYEIDKTNLVNNGKTESEEARDKQLADSLTEEEEARGEQHGTVQMSDVLNPIVERTVETETKTDRKDQTSQTGKLTQPEFEQIVDAMADSIMAQYPGLFTDKNEIKETILTGVSAYEMFALKQAGLGTGGYQADTDMFGNKVIKITNNGKPIDNLNMPGMWAIELAEGCSSVSKPSIETFISSKEAIAAFEWSIGFSGTFSTAVKGIIKDLHFAEIGGTDASSIRLGITSAIVRDQHNISEIIVEAHNQFNQKGVAAVEFLLTPNSDITVSMVSQIKSHLTGQFIADGLSPKEASKKAASQIVSLSVDTIDADLAEYVSDAGNISHTDPQYRKSLNDKLDEKMGEGNRDISRLTMQEKMALMMELLKIKVKAGHALYIVLDVDNGGRGLNFSDMTSALDNIRGLNDVNEGVRQQQKVQATLWAVNFEKMDGTQYEQALGRLDHRGGTARFSENSYHRDIVQITSVESARENKVVRDAAKKNGGNYSIDVILDSLNEIQFQNEQDKLAKAGSASATSMSAARDKITPLSRQKAQSLLQAQGLSVQSAASAIETVISSVEGSDSSIAAASLSERETVAVENYAKFLSLSKELIADYDATKLNDYMLVDAAALSSIIEGNIGKTLGVIKEFGAGTTERFEKLSAAVADTESKYPAGLESYNSIVSQMNEKEKILLQAWQEGKKLGFLDNIILMRTGIIKAQKKLAALAKTFEEAAEDTGLVLNTKSGVISYGELVIPVQPETSMVTEGLQRQEQEPMGVAPGVSQSEAVPSSVQMQQPVQPAQQSETVPSVQEQQPEVVSIINAGTQEVSVPEVQQPLQPAVPVINITTPLSIVNGYGMPAVVEKVQGIVGSRAVVGEREIEAALKNCAVDVLTAMERVTEINALGSLLADVILTQASPEVGLDYELAAGLGKDGKQIMLKDVRKHGRGLEYALAQELEKLKLSAEGVIGILKKSDEETLHLINIRGVKDGVVSYIESGKLKEAALDEFKAMGFEGLIMTDRKTKRVNKGLLSSLNASDEQIRKLFEIEASDKEKFARSGEYKGARKLANVIVDGVTEGEELNKAVLYALNIWKNTAEMAGALGIEESDVDSENGAEKVTQGYYEKVSEVLRAGEEGVLSPGEVMAEVKLLSTVRDMLITINKDDAGKMKELLNKESLELSDISNIMSLLTVSKAVNHNVMIDGLVSVKDDIKKDGLKKDEIINIEKLKGAVEEKKGLKEKFAGRFFASGAKLEEVLPVLGSDTFVNVRGTMHSPMMARALAAAA